MKKVCSFMMGLLLHYAVFSQVPFAGGYSPPAYADVDTTFNSYVNNIFGLLEPGRVSTGLLADYAFVRQREVITLSGLLFNYNTISPTAQSDGKIQTVNGRLQDRYISGVWQNPYLLQTAVATSIENL